MLSQSGEKALLKNHGKIPPSASLFSKVAGKVS